MRKQLTNNQIYNLYNTLNTLAVDYKKIYIPVKEGLKLVKNINYLTSYYWELENQRQIFSQNNQYEELEKLGQEIKEYDLEMVDLNNLKLPLHLIIGLSPLLRG